MNSIKQNSEQIAEIAKKIGRDNGLDENELLKSNELNDIFRDAVKQFDELQRELERNGL